MKQNTCIIISYSNEDILFFYNVPDVEKCTSMRFTHATICNGQKNEISVSRSPAGVPDSKNSYRTESNMAAHTLLPALQPRSLWTLTRSRYPGNGTTIIPVKIILRRTAVTTTASRGYRDPPVTPGRFGSRHWQFCFPVPIMFAAEFHKIKRNR